MTYKELKSKIKEEQKSLARKIRNGKVGRKPSKRTSDNANDYDNLFWNRIDYRHNHIIYCHMFNGTPYERIENPKDGNSPSAHRLESIRKKWEGELDEALRDCA